MDIMHEETLGPIAPIMTYTDLNQAIQIANDTPCDLAAYYFTNNYRTGIYIHDQLEYDFIGWHDDGSSAAQAPFDGMKKSGPGREGGTKGIEAYIETKYLSIGNL